MAEAILDLRLDTVQPNRVRLVYGVQNDYNSRYICARFLANGTQISIEKTASPSINAKRPDGEKRSFPGTVNADGTVKVPVTQWMLEVPGEVKASVAAVTSSGRLTTQEFYIMAKDSVWDGTDEPSAENPDKDVIQTIIASENERVAAEEARKAQFATWSEEVGKIPAFEKRIENLETAISPGFVTPTTDSTVAYSKTVPDGALPNAAITEIGGMSYVVDGTIRDSKVTEMKSVGANLIGGVELAQKIIALTSTTSNDEVNKKITFQASGISGKSIYSDFEKNTVYTFIFYGKNTLPTAKACNMAVDYEDGTSASLNFATAGSDSYCVLTTSGKSIKQLRGQNAYNATEIYYEKSGIFKGNLTSNDFSAYFENALHIPEAMQNLDGYGQGVNAQYYNKIVLDPSEGVKKYVQVCAKRAYLSGDERLTSVLTDGKSETIYILATPVEIDVSSYFTDDNLLRVEAGGTITAVNEYEQAVPFTVEYMIKGA